MIGFKTKCHMLLSSDIVGIIRRHAIIIQEKN